MSDNTKITPEEFDSKMNQVHNVDCVEFMKTIPDNYFDLILTDPPYEIAKLDAGESQLMSLDKFTSKGKLANISDGFDIDVVLNEFVRILKKANMFIFCSNKQVSKIMKFGEDRGFYTTLLVWHKNNSVPFANGVWRGDIEFCVHMREKGSYFEGDASLKQKVTKLPSNPSKFGHPTEKPIALVDKYLRIGATQGHKVFDPFMGSGTTAVVCKALGIDYCGCEIEEEYCVTSNTRTKSVQARLF